MKKSISLIIMIFGLSLMGSYFIYDKSSKKINEVVANEYIGKPMVINSNEIDNDSVIGVLHIPKINFKMGFYNYDSKKNNVDKNIALLNNTLPDKDKGTMIIAAHSGNSYLGYFKNLDKLNINDMIEIYYQDKEYIYIIDNIYEEDKDGTITYNKNINENILILTTCSKNKDKQLIINSKLYKII